MKKRMLFVGSLFICGILFFSACETTDLTAPKITLLGSGDIIQNLHVNYVDAGATAEDNKDGNITTSIVTTGLPISIDLCGETIIHYNVSDKAGNAADEVTRSVKIKSDLLAGTYDVTETKKAQYNVVVTQSSTTYNKILMNNFGGYGTTQTLEAIVEGSTITIPAQNVVQGADTYVIQGTGTYNGALFKILTVTYTETLSPQPPTTYNATYTKM
jgi:hypothetical protein